MEEGFIKAEFRSNCLSLVDIRLTPIYISCVITSWKQKGLRELFLTGSSAKVRSDQQRKCLRLLDALEQAAVPEDLNIPGWHFHALQGKPKRFAVAVNGPWRMTFGFVDGGVIDVDLEQYY